MTDKEKRLIADVEVLLHHWRGADRISNLMQGLLDLIRGLQGKNKPPVTDDTAALASLKQQITLAVDQEICRTDQGWRDLLIEILNKS